jgi:hypothetical protein
MIRNLICFLAGALMLCGCLSLPSREGSCAPPPKTFQESDLVGTWGGAPGNSSGTTLILKGDHTYKEIYNNKTTGQSYECGWQRWSLEYRANGIPHLHLKGMRLCDEGEEYCQMESGGGGKWLWRDFCDNASIIMRDEVILLVLGVPARFATPPPGIAPPPRGIELFQPQADPDSGASVFQLQR